MKAETLKKAMHQAIDLIDDKDFLKAIHTLLNEKSKEYEFFLAMRKRKNSTI